MASETALLISDDVNGPVTFGLFMPNVDEAAAAAVWQLANRQLSQMGSTLACGVAVVHGPITEAQESYLALIDSAERTLRAVEPAVPKDHSDALGV